MTNTILDVRKLGATWMNPRDAWSVPIDSAMKFLAQAGYHVEYKDFAIHATPIGGGRTRRLHTDNNGMISGRAMRALLNVKRPPTYGPTDQIYMGIAEIADYFDVSKQVVSNWISRKEDWPKPAAELAMGRIYHTQQIIEYGYANDLHRKAKS